MNRNFKDRIKNTVTLYKSLSPVQLATVINTDWRSFPTSLPDQKNFSPKLNKSYAEMLARQMEAAYHTAGYVVAFQLQKSFIDQFELQTISYQEHYEYRIPVNQLEQLNRALIGQIKLVSAFSVHDSRIWKKPPRNIEILHSRRQH